VGASVRKINKRPETKREFYRCHYKMWDEIVKKLETQKVGGRCSISYSGLKILAYKKCFGFSPTTWAMCFLCDYQRSNNSSDCNTCPIFITYGGCISGTPFGEMIDSLNTDKKFYKATMIKLAKQIRDCVL
jgi:hypothetical protein